jgi:hypothetical protein
MLQAIVGASSCPRVVLAVKFSSCRMLWNVQAESGQTAELNAPPNPELGAAHVTGARQPSLNTGATMALCWKQGVPLFFGCSRPRARAPVTRFGLVFVFGHLGHHGLVSDFRVSDSGVVGPALLAPGRVVMDTRSLHGLEARSSAGAPLRRHTCSRSRHPAPLTQG